MRIPSAGYFVAAFFVLARPAASQQVRLSARVGAVWSSELVKDVIVNPVTVKPGIAPTVALTATIPMGARYRIGLQGSLSSGSIHARENGTDTDLGSLRIATLGLVSEGPILFHGLVWRVGVGAIKYLPGDHQGIFLQGGSTRILGSAGIEFRRTIRPGWEGMGGVHYSLHSFTTDELKARGFSRAQVVHRVGLDLGVARYF